MKMIKTNIWKQMTVFNTTAETCEKIRYADYDKAYDYIKKNCEGIPKEIVKYLKEHCDIIIDEEDADEFMHLPMDKIYRCPEGEREVFGCRGNLVIKADKRIMECDKCHAVFSLDEEYLCPLCEEDTPLTFDEKTEKFHCASCGLDIDPQRFARPKDNWIGVFHKGWAKVTPRGVHHHDVPPPSSLEEFLTWYK